MNGTGWALGLGALVKGPEYVNSGFDLYKNIRDYADTQANNQAARDSIDNLAWAAQEDNPNVRLENFREISRDMSRKPLNASTALTLQKEIDTNSKNAIADIKTLQTQNRLAAFQKEAADSGTDLVSYGMQHPDRIPLEALQGVHSALSTFATAAEKEITRREKDQKELEKEQNISNFQRAISGITGPSTSPVDLKQFAGRGGYAPFSDVESDYRQAAADYSVPAETLNKEIDNARQAYKDTYLPSVAGKVGRTSYTGQSNLLGDFRKDAQSTAPIIKISTGEGGVKDSDFRSWLKDGKSATLSTMKFNRPDQLAIMMAIAKNPDKSDTLMGQLEQSMTPEQKAELDKGITNYINTYAPDSMIAEYTRRIKRTAGKQKVSTEAAPMFATNPSTGQKIVSNDGGKSWRTR